MKDLDQAPHPKQLAALIFELASQLHVERAQRLALQAALDKAGLLDPAALRAMAADAGLQDASRKLLEESIARLLGTLTEDADPMRPLRDTATDDRPPGGKS